MSASLLAPCFSARLAADDFFDVLDDLSDDLVFAVCFSLTMMADFDVGDFEMCQQSTNVRCGDQEAKGRLGARDSGSKPIGKLRNVESGR